MVENHNELNYLNLDRMKKTLIIILLIINNVCVANMASPIRRGTLTSSALTSRDIHIVKERIYIEIDENFNTASYIVEYVIKTDYSGTQIPLLFHAKDYKGGFNVFVDDQAIELMDIKKEINLISNSPFNKFLEYFQEKTEKYKTIDIHWKANQNNTYYLRDLKYFETDLSKGEHKIRLEYVAKAWTNISDWIKKYSFKYSLSPAKYWKSFGSIEIVIKSKSLNSFYSTNIGKPVSQKGDSIAIWKFTEIPNQDYLEINYTPEISLFAKLMIKINIMGLVFIISSVLIFLHFLSIKKHRKKKPLKKYSWIVITGSIVIPFLILVSYIISYEIIDSVIGVEAGGHHGYTFLVIIFYPLLLPIYWLIMWYIDRKIKYKQQY